MKGILALLCIIFAVGFAQRTLIANNISPRTYSQLGKAETTHSINFKVLLNQRNLDVLDQTFWDVSNPKHERYGQFLTRSEVDRMVAADPQSVQRVVNWLFSEGLTANDIQIFADFIAVRTKVSIAERIFETSFFEFQSPKGKKILRIKGEASVPNHIADDIDFVVGLSEFLADAHHTPVKSSSPNRANLGSDPVVVPSVLEDYYDIDNKNVPPTSNIQGIAAFDDFFSKGALDQFVSELGLSTPNYARIGYDCFLYGSCDQFESDLDIQYITSIGSGIPTLFLAQQPGDWILDWAIEVYQINGPPLVNSISYGWSELEQCEITEGCQTFGYTSTQYVNRTNVQLAKLGTLGITVTVSDGDDGAPSLGGSSGNCPLDQSLYCPVGGCNHTRSYCSELTITNQRNGSACFFPMGLASSVCGDMLGDSDVQQALQNFVSQNSQCDIAVETDLEGNPHIYSSCDCNNLQSVTFHRFEVAAYVFYVQNGPVFTAEYPASSPYITSVGATQFVAQGGRISYEMGASILTGAIITTGGGFSSFQPQPSFQSDAVTYFLQNSNALPPNFAYNGNMRAYPDVSFSGHHYYIMTSNNSNNYDQCPCQGLTVDGTSCSSPSFAGMISLINSQLLSKGASPLGPLNQLLYQMSSEFPDAFHDITEGNNRCNRAYCCNYGWTAMSGWDPVSGLGTPDYGMFLKYILQQKGL
eukprot:TRINITY_DN3762_c0_g1_i5.p1 TRINITY_DN3762_c0_g1~~TRINITY_DN3762_c0_g1_i5.p1  ORF type:complete len:699 (-),score=146.51 TRINITY_DN3762_c0_g1_i5:100-2196(-)